MEKYLYLTEPEWAEAWISGGQIPLSLASTYIRDFREGTYTPDENLIHDSPVNLKSLSPLIHIEEGAGVKGLTIKDCSFNGIPIPNIINASYYIEDGLILSLSNTFNEDIGRRLGKKACVKITNIEMLRKKIDKQVGCRGVMAKCEYTADHQRSHFKKSIDDSWQDEFRIFWKYPRSKWVNIPEGIAELVATF